MILSDVIGGYVTMNLSSAGSSSCSESLLPNNSIFTPTPPYWTEH